MNKLLYIEVFYCKNIITKYFKRSTKRSLFCSYTFYNNNFLISINSQNMNWIILIVAGLFEVAFAFCLGKAKQTSGNEMYLWYVGFLLTLTCSMLLLIKATQTLPIGTAYAVWTGIGAIGTVLVGILVFKEPATMLRIFFLFTLIGSIVGLKAVTN